MLLCDTNYSTPGDSASKNASTPPCADSAVPMHIAVQHPRSADGLEIMRTNTCTAWTYIPPSSGGPSFSTTLPNASTPRYGDTVHHHHGCHCESPLPRRPGPRWGAGRKGLVGNLCPFRPSYTHFYGDLPSPPVACIVPEPGDQRDVSVAGGL